MSVSPSDYFRCRSCEGMGYCTLFLYCEMCGYREPEDVKKHGKPPNFNHSKKEE